MASVELNIELAWSPEPGRVQVLPLRLPIGATVEQALAHLPLGVPQQTVGIWGHKAERHDGLRDGDRVEVYRPLTVDPMEARRRRHEVHGGRRIVSRHRPMGRG
ncbi:RnfH family protein [Inhella gelatinilytica]|uniref:UPF0125 protein I7X43_14610 n=1 Tax=Inhella gelatinilytica TaxID=2795030 RepID=A0A931NEU7_9BURK|nr:RnfH family protein [Inhella gelatinilytica]MBH9554074.1 RnfH family protein [Inhella gelatinilytica]